MIPIVVDLNETIIEFSLDKSQADQMLQYVVREVTAQIAHNWDNQAKLNLHSTRDMYRNSLVVGERGRFTGLVTLLHKLPNMIEDGASAFDIKKGFELSPKAKHKADGGWYITVPFRQATPGALGESEVFSNIMPGEIHSAVKNFRGRETAMVGFMKGRVDRIADRLKLDQIPDQYKAPTVRPAITTKNASFEAYTHKNSIYEGMQKSEKTYESATQGTYVTFRRVSDNSDPMSWIHSGFVAHNLAQKALDATNVPHEVDKAVDDYLAAAGF